MNGTIADANIRSSGDGDAYVLGTTTSVTVNSTGDGDIKLRNANGKPRHHYLDKQFRTMCLIASPARLHSNSGKV